MRNKRPLRCESRSSLRPAHIDSRRPRKVKSDRFQAQRLVRIAFRNCFAVASFVAASSLYASIPAKSEIINVGGINYKVFALPTSTPGNLSSDELTKIKGSPWWGGTVGGAVPFASASGTAGTVFATSEIIFSGDVFFTGVKADGNGRALYYPYRSTASSFAWGFLAPAPKPGPDNPKGALTSLISCVTSGSVNASIRNDCLNVLASANASGWEQLTAEPYASNLSVGLEAMNKFRKNALAVALADNKFRYSRAEDKKVCDSAEGAQKSDKSSDPSCKTVSVKKNLPWSLIIDGTNTQASLNATQDLGSLSYNIFQSTYGLEYAFGKQFSLGGVFGYGQANLYNYEFSDTRVNSDTYSGGLYGLYKPSEPAMVALLAGYSRFDSDSRRPIQFGSINRLAEADWNSNAYTIALTGEYSFILSGANASPNLNTASAAATPKQPIARNAIRLKPKALVSFASYSQGLIEETGAQALNLKLNPHTATSVIFGGGLVLETPILVSSQSRLIPRFGVGYQYDLNGNSAEEHEVTGGFLELPEAGEIDVYGQNRGSNDLDVSLGLEYEISSNTAIYSNVAGSFWSNGNELTYGGGFRYSW